MKNIIVRAMLVGVVALCGSGMAQANGQANGDCGMNSNKPCPPPKTSAKEPAYQGLNSNTPKAQQAGTPPARASVQPSESGEPQARATLSGVSASDLKKPPVGDCGMNSNKPCADEGSASPPARVKAGDGDETAAKATLSGVNPNDLKLKPKVPETFEKEPASKP